LPGSSSISSPSSEIIFLICLVFGLSYLPYLVGSNNVSSLNIGSSTSCSLPYFFTFCTLTTLFWGGYIFESDLITLYLVWSISSNGSLSDSGFSST
jgi:hypothetical protein